MRRLHGNPRCGLLCLSVSKRTPVNPAGSPAVIDDGENLDLQNPKKDIKTGPSPWRRSGAEIGNTERALVVRGGGVVMRTPVAAGFFFSSLLPRHAAGAKRQAKTELSLCENVVVGVREAEAIFTPAFIGSMLAGGSGRIVAAAGPRRSIFSLSLGCIQAASSACLGPRLCDAGALSVHCHQGSSGRRT